MMVLFYYRAMETGKDETGIPIYDDRVFIQVTMDPTTTVDRPADEDDFQRFPDHYAHFLKSTAAYIPIEGQVPLEMWPIATPADVASLKARDVRSVQQLAKVTPTQSKSWPSHILALVEHAKSYMSVAGGAADTAKEVSTLRSTLADLNEEVSMLRAENKMLKAEAKKAEHA